jgi:hypothetical protein
VDRDPHMWLACRCGLDVVRDPNYYPAQRRAKQGALHRARTELRPNAVAWPETPAVYGGGRDDLTTTRSGIEVIVGTLRSPRYPGG